MSEKQGFWSSLPGILTGVAAVITALTGLYVAVFNFTGDTPAENPEPATSIGNVSTEIGGEQDEPVINPLPDSPGFGSPKIVHSKPPETLVEKDFAAFPKTGPLVMCEHFPSVNSVNSLMSWSNHYHKKIVEGHESKPEYSCNKAIGNRGRAHCMEPDNQEIRQALLESLALCRKLGFEWHQVSLNKK